MVRIVLQWRLIGPAESQRAKLITTHNRAHI